MVAYGSHCGTGLPDLSFFVRGSASFRYVNALLNGTLPYTVIARAESRPAARFFCVAESQNSLGARCGIGLPRPADVTCVLYCLRDVANIDESV